MSYRHMPIWLILAAVTVACAPEPPPTALSLPTVTSTVTLAASATSEVILILKTATIAPSTTSSVTPALDPPTATLIDTASLEATPDNTPDATSNVQASVEAGTVPVTPAVLQAVTSAVTEANTIAAADTTQAVTEAATTAVPVTAESSLVFLPTIVATDTAVQDTLQDATIVGAVEPTLDATTNPIGTGIPTLTLPTAEAITPAAIETVSPSTVTEPPNPTETPRTVTNMIVHVVTPNENLSDIARRYGITVEQITAANLIYNPNNLLVGQRLLVPVRMTVAPTATPTNTQTQGPTSTPEPTSTPVEDLGIITPSAPDANLGEGLPQTINGLPISSMITLDGDTRARIRQTYACGLKNNGNNAQAFSKMGDCNSEYPYFLGRFDKSDGGTYNLGRYSSLQSIIDYYAGSFGRRSVATQVGLHSWSVFDSAWANRSVCNRGENVIDCELRINNPSLMLIALGTNDTGAPTLFEKHMRQIVETCLAEGVIPVLATKADRYGGSNRINEVTRKLAAEYRIPLWDYEVMAATMANRGLDGDNIHMTIFYSHDYTQPQALQRGHGVQNLAALYVLQEIQQALQGVTAADCPN